MKTAVVGTTGSVETAVVGTTGSVGTTEGTTAMTLLVGTIEGGATELSALTGASTDSLILYHD